MKRTLYHLLICMCMSPVALIAQHKPAYYAYKEGMYILDSGKKIPFSVSSIISYGGYLIEMEDYSDIKTGGPDTAYISVTTDQDGKPLEKEKQISAMTITANTPPKKYVYILKGENKQFYQFDTFALNARIISHGPFKDKKEGRAYGPPTSDTLPGSGIIRDTVVDNIPLSYINISSDPNITGYAYLAKNAPYNTFFKTFGYRYTDPAYSFIGVHAFDRSKNQGTSFGISDLRPLTPAEIRICEAMVNKIEANAKHK